MKGRRSKGRHCLHARPGDLAIAFLGLSRRTVLLAPADNDARDFHLGGLQLQAGANNSAAVEKSGYAKDHSDFQFH